MNSKRVLFAEDNPNDAALALGVLASSLSENEIELVPDGVEAMEYLNREGRFADRAPGNPELVILDLKMPRMDGLEVLKEMRKSDGLRSVPVVVLSSSHEASDVARSYELGTNAYVVKPVVYEEFAAAIESLSAFWTTVNDPPPP